MVQVRGGPLRQSQKRLPDGSRQKASCQPIEPPQLRLIGVCLCLAFAFSPLLGVDTAHSSALSESRDSQTADQIAVHSYRIVNTYPHDPQAFTQGLVFDKGFLYEGTGLYGRSSLRKVDLQTGKILKRYELPSHFFGEGLTIFGDQIIQSTWKSNVAFVYDKHSFRLLQVFKYPKESWGITHDGSRLIMSDGTSNLRFLDPRTFKETGRIEVRDTSGPVGRLNELEYVQGEIYANVWRTDRIARISPHSGKITGWIDLTGLLGPQDRYESVDVLNGIAYDAENDRLFVTGKLWPKLFEIDLTRQQQK